ncbi:MAG: hypothetical protein Kow0068_00370 [Marinilabiliales bacterium]
MIFLNCFLSFSQGAKNQIYIRSINISGNKVTKASIINNELTFKINDTLSVEEFNKRLRASSENLENLSLFNFVYINHDIDSISQSANILPVDVKIKLVERWYIWPYPILEHADRNFSNFIKEKDWSRINYGGYLAWYNFRGRAENVHLKFRYGFKEQTELSYTVPNIDKSKKHGICTSFAYFRQKSLPVNTARNKLVYITNSDKYLTKYYNFKFIYRFRQKLNIYHYLSIINNRFFIDDTLAEINPLYTGGNYNDLYFTQLYYTFLIDYRNLKYYPTKGYLVEFRLGKTGFSNNPDIDYINYQAEISKYFSINNRFYYSVRFKTVLTAGTNNAYVCLGGLGYDDYLRGFEYYVINSNNYLLFNNMLRWNVISKKIFKIPYINTEKISKVHYSAYLGTFFDSGYAGNDEKITINNYLADDFLYSYGISFDFVTYYDKLLRIELSRNNYNETGVYIDFKKYF